MKLITSVKIEQADHTQVIDTAATKVGSAANKAFLFVIHKEIQGWHNLMTLCSCPYGGLCGQRSQNQPSITLEVPPTRNGAHQYDHDHTISIIY